MSDPAKYRTREEVEQVRKAKDPIEGLKRRILELEPSAELQLAKIDADVRAEIADAVEYAKRSPEPDPRDLFTDVYLSARQ